jgi:tellurite resistance protein
MLDHHSALIYTMVLASAAGSGVTDTELRTIGDIVTHLPIFAEYDSKQLTKTLSACSDLLQKENGLELALKEIKGVLPPRLRETAYALACDVVASDGEASQDELRFLEVLRDGLVIDRLVAVAIERGARARFMTL